MATDRLKNRYAKMHTNPYRYLKKNLMLQRKGIIALLFLCLLIYWATSQSPLQTRENVSEQRISPSELEVIHGAIDEELAIQLPLNNTSVNSAWLDNLMSSEPTHAFSQQSDFDLECYLEERAWNHSRIQSTFGRRHRPSRCTQRLQLQPVDTASHICSLIAGRRILLVGPESSFHLHMDWLHALEIHENRSHICPGAEFCNSHQICLPPADEPEDFFEKGGFKKLPSSRELASTASASLRYALSTTLYAASNSKDPMYTKPQIDASTGVRMRNSYWLGQAKKSDLIIMNRGPIPAPAWTYDRTAEGNWSFLDALPRFKNSNGVEVLWEGEIERKIIAAALYTTLFTFLPSVSQTFQTLRNQRDLRGKLLLWHGSWFIQPKCLNPQGRTITDPRSAFSTGPGTNHWVLYYNAQVYMQNYLLQSLLPRFDIPFIPQNVPMYTTNVTFVLQRSTQPRECLRYAFGSPVEEIMRSTLLSGVWKALEGLE
ncbi:hypothetical protein Moror_1499 [Moniliophthora roreri MCA 2997]|uniref:Uncharacterized protein n=2 Tax=Moniliophthora roreri TaxID=221103 RepID=V2XIZ1_MONRO|nr:hypothetical protein Moror_1499 [Moniliophthora roreri MCA 2997]